ncbi:tetratricopeptide repeat protein [Aestuariispira ectoiniformans]|uniref:tetratricopeptide repeat protein n=1 Tax=Aestuariispira ectoiniformans TaxID=2775080 RepID=UPI00223ACAC2|nr:tetratricopeptide repeat protein [Aestuariispira ectoiniformans]
MSQTSPDEGILRRVEAEAARLQAAGADKEVAQLCFQGLNRFGDTIGLLTPLAQTVLKHGDLTRAEGYLRRLLALQPENVDTLAIHANVLTAQERNEEAVAAQYRVLDVAPDRQDTLVNLGMLLVKMQRAEEALPFLRKAAGHTPDDCLVHTWLGYACSALGRLEEAIGSYEVVYNDPQHGPAVSIPLAIAYRDSRQLDKANSVLGDILTREPGNAVARFSLAQNQLTVGDFKQGFANYESRWDRPDAGRPAVPGQLWTGQPLAGKTILVHDEQGFGDCIQFSRFLKPLQGMGARVLFQVRPKLRVLMQEVEGIDAFVAPGEGEADYHVALMSLPLHLGAEADTIADGPYLAIPPEAREKWSERLGPKSGLRVGLVWQGDPRSQAEVGRSITFSVLRQLFDLDGCQFILLQKFHGRDEIVASDLPVNVLDLGEEIDNGPDAFVDTAAVISNLDIMVSSDTAAAHLAGAIGVPTYILLKYAPEWRWMLDQPDSIWYRDMTLLRQNERGNWQDVIERLHRILQQKSAGAD